MDNISFRADERALCEYRGIRYRVESVRNGLCTFHPFISSDCKIIKPIEEIDELWLGHIRSGKPDEAETLWLNPSVNEKPDSKTFYVEKMANGNVMTAHLSDILDYRSTAVLLGELYGKRIKLTFHRFYPDEDKLDAFTIDMQHFVLTEEFGIVCISPESESGNRYIFEFVDYFNNHAR